MQQLTTTLSKLLKTDGDYLARGGFWLLVGQVLNVGASMIITIALANLLLKSSYGTYQFIIATGAILSAFTLTGIGVAIRQAVATGKDTALRFGFRTQLLWSIGIMLAGGAVSSYYFWQGNQQLGTAFLFVGALVPFIESFGLYKSYLLGKKLFKESALLGLWRKPITIVSIGVALYFTRDPIILVFVYYASSIFSLGLIYSLTVRRYELSYERLPDIVSYGKQLSILNILKTVANNADRIIIFQTLGATQLAIYMLAILPMLHLQKLLGLIGHLVFPRFANHSFAAIRTNMLRKLLNFLAATAVIVLAYIFIAPYFYQFVFPAYTESIILSQVVMLTLLFKPATLITKVFESHKMIFEHQVITVSTLLLKLLMLYVFTHLYGIWGVVAAVILTSVYWSIASLTLFYLKRAQ